MEGYVQNLKLDMVGDELKLEARVYNARTHGIIVVTIADNNIQDQN